MLVHHIYYFTAAVILFAFRKVSAAASEQEECGLWMAPSTIPGGNLGMYAGRDYGKDVDLQNELAIPFLFRDWDGPRYFEPHKGDDNDGSLWFRYIWSGWVADLEQLVVNNIQNTKVVFVPGIGCTINSLLDMRNIQSAHGSHYDTAGWSRRDPSAGAFCPYHGTETTSTVQIPAGSELFADYGDEWIPEIPGAQITFHKVMDDAEDFIRDDYYTFVTQHQHKMTDRLKEGLWNFTRDFPHSNPKTFTVLPRGVTWNEIEKQLEVSPEARLMEELPYYYYSEESSIVRHFIRHNGKRSLEWLHTHGRCSDHMRPGNSTLPHAGRGAFATRFLPNGTIVGYSPLVHVGMGGVDLYTVPYHLGRNGEYSYSKPDLIYNYAYGHPNSTVLLSPYGSMVNYINHAPSTSSSSSSTKNQVQANVRLQWPAHEMEAHIPEWLDKDVYFLANTLEKIGLSFDYVALRDIQEGEEIFMDYGPEWEAAWTQHLENWVPPSDADQYVHSSQWPADTTLRTVAELVENPYPTNLHTICLPSYQYDPQKQHYTYLIPDRDYIDRVVCHVLERLPPTTDPNQPPSPSDNDNNNNNNNNNDNYSYTVELVFDNGITKQVWNFPHTSIWVTDRIMSQDWHLPNTFRHPIMIPDEIFPQSWKNLLQTIHQTTTTTTAAAAAAAADDDDGGGDGEMPPHSAGGADNSDEL